MSTVSYNRVVDVSVDVNDRFATVANFSIPLILTIESAGNIETDIVKSFSSLDGLKAYGYATDSETYLTAAAMLATTYAPSTFKIGYHADGNTLAESFSLMLAADSGFYAVVMSELVDASQAEEIIALNSALIAAGKIGFFNVNDIDQRDDGNSTTSLASQLRNASPSKLAGFFSENTSGVAGTPAIPKTTTLNNGYVPTVDTSFDEPISAQGYYGNVAGNPVFVLTYPEGWVGASTPGEVVNLPTNTVFDLVIPSNIETSEDGTVYTLTAQLHVTRNVYPEGTDPSTFDLETTAKVDDHNNTAIAGTDSDFTTADGIVRLKMLGAQGSESADYNGFNNNERYWPPGSYVVTEGSPAIPDIVSAGISHYAAKAAAYVSNVNYNNADSHYTLKFKRLDGELPSKLTDIQAQNLTGFLPGTGLDDSAGGFLNAYVCTAGLNFVVEGITTDGTFVDLVTFVDWFKATMQQNVLSVFTNAKVVPYDNTGVSMLYAAVVQTCESALLAGAATEQRFDINENLLPAYEVNVAAIASVAPGLQAQRIGPSVQYCLRYSNGIHFASIEGTVKVAN